MVEKNRRLVDWLTEGKDKALDQKIKYDIFIRGHKEHRFDVSDALISASLIGSFA